MRGVFQMKNRPFVLGGLSLILGYAHAWASRTPSPIPQDLRAFHRREQMMRLRRMCAGLVSLRRRSSSAPNGVVDVGGTASRL
jgi:hypothetical protein